MTRLIDADELLLYNTYEWFDDWGNYTNAGEIISNAPTVDAVEVVRCKNCKHHRYHSNYYYCEYHSSPYLHDHFRTNEDDFCSHGEKEEKMTCKDCKHFYPLKRKNGEWSYACTVLTGIDPDAFVLEIDGNGLCEMYENGLNLDFKADNITT